MQTAIKDVRRHMVRKEQRILGRVSPISALAAQTATVNTLAIGGQSEQAWQGVYMVRADTASIADRVRYSTEAAMATGLITHAGTAYADTTATDELLELLFFDPLLFDEAINQTLRDLMRLDITVLPGMTSVRRFWLHELPWILNPKDIYKITKSSNPVLSRDRYFENWDTYDAGALQPQWWKKTGASSTWARSETVFTTDKIREGRKWALEVTRSGTNVEVEQVVGLMFGGVDSSSLQGGTVTVFGRVKSPSSAVSSRLYVADGVAQTYGSYHTGSDNIEEMSQAVTVDDDATQLRFGLSLEADETIEILELGLAFTTALDDSIRYGDTHYPPTTVWVKTRGRTGTDLPIDLPPLGLGMQYQIHSQRPLPTLTQSRIDAGSVDTDETDAPLNIIFRGALANLFTTLSAGQHEDTTRYQQIALNYQNEYDELKAEYLGLNTLPDTLPFRRRGALAGPPNR
jgi:hypothetical protein